MKPIIIIKEKNTNGNFELTEKELKELIEQAYEQGVEDGKQHYNWWVTTPPTITLKQRNTEPNYPHDVFGNPVTYCTSGTVSNPKDTQVTLNNSAVSTIA